MAIKELQTRIALKYDSYSAWTSAPGKDLVLLAGELGICYIEAADQGSQVVPTVLFKVGNGTSTFEQLPWASAKAADVYGWAKASNVTVDGKSIKFVGGAVDAEGNKIDKVITLNFATPEEVESKVATERARIAALEAKFTGESSVQGQIDALDGRLDAIENAETGAVATANAYTDTREAAIKDAYEAYADQAEADAKKDAADKLAAAKQTLEAADAELGGRIDALVGDKGTIATGDAATLEAAKTYAKDYADGLAGNYDAAGAAATAEQNAKDYADDAVEAAVTAQGKVDQDQDAEIAKKLDASVYTAYIAGKEMSDEALKEYADGKASAAESAAITAAKTETETQINTLVANGQVKTNTDAIAKNKADIAAMDAAYKAADEALDARLDKVETFFEGAYAEDGKALNEALDTLVEIQTYLDGDGSAAGSLIGRVAQAEEDIDDLEAEFAAGGRVTVAEKDIDDLQAAVATKLATDTFNTWTANHAGENADHAKSATAITAEIGAAVKVEKDRAEGAEKAIKDTIGTIAEGNTVAGLIKAAQDQADDGVTRVAAVEGRMTTAEGKIGTLEGASHTHANSEELAKIASGDKDKWDEAYAKRHEHANKAELDKIVDGDKAKWDTAATNAGNAVADLAALTSDSGRIATAEGKINALQTLTAGFEGTIKAAVDAAKQAGDEAKQAVTDLANGQVKTNTTNIEGHETRIAAIEENYVKATDLVSDLYIFNCGSATTVTHEQPKA